MQGIHSIPLYGRKDIIMNISNWKNNPITILAIIVFTLTIIGLCIQYKTRSQAIFFLEEQVKCVPVDEDTVVCKKVQIKKPT